MFTIRLKEGLVLVSIVLILLFAWDVFDPQEIMAASSPPITVINTDLGHGSGCVHNHFGSCYHAHVYSCYGGHSWDRDSTYAFTCPVCHVDGAYVEVSYPECQGCGLSSSHAGFCSNCGRKTGIWDEYQNGKCTDSFKCGKTTSTLVCYQGTYGNCIMPVINDDSASKAGWTNQTITINYTGAQSGNLQFSENGSKDIKSTSSSGHALKRSLTVTTIDKLAPNKTILKLN